MRLTIQRIILSSRYLLIPLYVGMTASVLLFGVKFFQELRHLFETVSQAKEADLVLGILSLVDMMLVANLLIMVIISGYESFVGPIQVEDMDKKPGWLGNLDPGTIKIKVATSIVGISSVHLLATFLNIKDKTSEQIFWLTILHLAFVVSALFLAYIDRITSK